ncbi:MAG: hypothetical protein GTO14_26035 [Anaerolineales bacterium]|nr:hypothetical protein [Anaerolineales bacterium]
MIALLATLASVWNWWTYNWWARISVNLFGGLLFLAMSFRAWMGVIPVIWTWLVPILGAYLLAWVLPIVNPNLSEFLWREQTAPRTRLGQAILRVSIAIAPVVGVLGASAGMFGSRLGELDLTLTLLGSLLSLVAIVFAFAASHQLWPERPWAKNEAKETAET